MAGTGKLFVAEEMYWNNLSWMSAGYSLVGFAPYFEFVVAVSVMGILVVVEVAASSVVDILAEV